IAMFSAIARKCAPAWPARVGTSGSPGNWCSRSLCRTINSPCARAASASSGLHCSGPSPCAARSRLVNDRSWLTSSGSSGVVRCACSETANDKGRSAQPRRIRPQSVMLIPPVRSQITHANLVVALQIPVILERPRLCDDAAMARATLRYRLKHQPLAVIGVLLLVLFIAMALVASAAAPYDPAAIDLAHRLL